MPLTFTLKSKTDDNEKQSCTTIVVTSLFPYSTCHSSLPIFQQHQLIEFTFYNPYVILGPSKAILWTELLTLMLLKQGYIGSRLKSSPQNSTITVMVWMILANYPFKTFILSDATMRNRKFVLFESTCGQPGCIGVVGVAYIFSWIELSWCLFV